MWYNIIRNGERIPKEQKRGKGQKKKCSTWNKKNIMVVMKMKTNTENIKSLDRLIRTSEKSIYTFGAVHNGNCYMFYHLKSNLPSDVSINPSDISFSFFLRYKKVYQKLMIGQTVFFIVDILNQKKIGSHTFHTVFGIDSWALNDSMVKLQSGFSVYMFKKV